MGSGKFREPASVSLSAQRVVERYGGKIAVESRRGQGSAFMFTLPNAITCELTVIEDGAEALEFIRQLDNSLPSAIPDLTILDLNLPKTDGFEILQAMRAERVFAGVPVAVLSSSSSPRERARIDVFQVEQYITKPADLDEFMKIGQIVKSLLANSNSQGQFFSSGM
jgi:CheY-like chemotaxis protein